MNNLGAVMKRVIFAILIIGLFLSVPLFADISKELKQEFLKEQKALEEAERELAYYKKIVSKRKEVKALDVLNKTFEVKSEFEEDSADIEDFFEDKNLKKINKEYKKLRAIYGQIDYVQDSFLWWQANKAILANNHNKSQIIVDNLSALLNNFKSSNHYVSAYYLLLDFVIQQSKINPELNWVFIDSWEKFTSSLTVEQKQELGEEKQNKINYYLAQAYYNTDNADDATSIFESLVNNDEFGQQSKLMLALIATSNQGSEVGIQKFSVLKNQLDKGSKYYSFVLLSLARLNTDLKNLDTAISYYEEYATATVPNNGIKYEMADVYRQLKNYPKAIEYLQAIVADENANEYFVPSKYLLSVIEQEQGNLNLAEKHLNDAIAKNNEVVELLNKKADLITQSQVQVNKITPDLSNKQRYEIADSLQVIKDEIVATNADLKSLSKGLNANQVSMLKSIEDDYFAKNLELTDLEKTINELRNTSNKAIPKLIEDRIKELETDKIVISAYRYLYNMDEEPRRDDYIIAFSIASNIYSDSKLLENWKAIEEMAAKKGDVDKADRAKVYQNMLNENLTTLNKLADQKFGAITDTAKVQVKLLAEADEIAETQVQLKQLKQQVVKDYNNRLAERKVSKISSLTNEASKLQQQYTDSVSNISSEAKAQNQKFEYSLLEILYKQAQKLEEEYNKQRDEKAEENR